LQVRSNLHEWQILGAKLVWEYLIEFANAEWLALDSLYGTALTSWGHAQSALALDFTSGDDSVRVI
jgi:hypothetical protein